MAHPPTGTARSAFLTDYQPPTDPGQHLIKLDCVDLRVRTQEDIELFNGLCFLLETRILEAGTGQSSELQGLLDAWQPLPYYVDLMMIGEEQVLTIAAHSLVMHASWVGDDLHLRCVPHGERAIYMHGLGFLDFVFGTFADDAVRLIAGHEATTVTGEMLTALQRAINSRTAASN